MLDRKPHCLGEEELSWGSRSYPQVHTLCNGWCRHRTGRQQSVLKSSFWDLSYIAPTHTLAFQSPTCWWWFLCYFSFNKLSHNMASLRTSFLRTLTASVAIEPSVAWLLSLTPHTVVLPVTRNMLYLAIGEYFCVFVIYCYTTEYPKSYHFTQEWIVVVSHGCYGPGVPEQFNWAEVARNMLGWDLWSPVGAVSATPTAGRWGPVSERPHGPLRDAQGVLVMW